MFAAAISERRPYANSFHWGLLGPNVAVASEAACISAVNDVKLINSFDGSVGVSVSSTNPDRVAPVRMSFQLGVIRMSDRTRSTAASAAYSVWLPAR
jgi:hypothetical protein